MLNDASAEQFADPIWRLHNLYWINDKTGKTVLFRPNEAQLEFIQSLHNRNVILKARRLGFTTVCCLTYLDDCLFNPNVAAALIAHRLPDAEKIFQTKIKFPYDQLPDALKERISLVRENTSELAFSNNSNISVTTSARSDTLNWLHISEYGKICAHKPDVAREIVTGSFPATSHGVITIESTAEGEGGDFYDRTMNAQKLVAQGADLTSKDFKFFFFPWWADPSSSLPRSNVPVSSDDEEYFEATANDIRADPILSKRFNGFSQEQKNWWVTEENEYGGDMKREYPATPKEAFEQALEGAIFANDFASAYKHHRIGHFPLDTRFPVNTFWDLGMSSGNATSIWLEQDIQGQPRMVHYMEFEGEIIDYILGKLKEWGLERGVTWGKHYWPHDGDRKMIWLPEGTLALAGRLGFNPSIVPVVAAKWEAVQVGRRRFSQVQWDAEGCKLGLTLLKKYRKEHDDRRNVWRDHPYHGPESNCADAYLTFAQSNHITEMPAKSYADDAHKRRYYEADSEESWMTA